VKTPHETLTEAAVIELKVQDNTGEDQGRFITLGYHCAEWSFLVCNGVMAEVLPLPKINSVPRSPSYCWGVCNIRGNIVSVFDLSERITGQSEFERRDRLYVLLQGDVSSQVGVVVRDIPKSMRFSISQQVQQASHVPDELAPYMKGVYREQEVVWHELDILGLLKAH